MTDTTGLLMIDPVTGEIIDQKDDEATRYQDVRKKDSVPTRGRVSVQRR